MRALVLVLALLPSLALACGFRASLGGQDLRVEWEGRYGQIFFPEIIHNAGNHFDGARFTPPKGKASFSAQIWLSQSALPGANKVANYVFKLLRIEALDPYYEVGTAFCVRGEFKDSMTCNLNVAFEQTNGTDTYGLFLFSSKAGVVIDGNRAHTNFSASCSQ